MKFKNTLFIAPNYKKRKGGIASVLGTYSVNIKNFNFLPSAYFLNKWLNFIFLPLMLINYSFYLLLNRNIKIVHIHGASRGSFYRKYFYFLIGKKVFSKKIIYHIHGAEYHIFFKQANRILKRLVSNMINYSDGLIVLSSEWSVYFKENFEQKNIYVVNNIVPYNHRISKPEPEIIKFLFLGKIGNRKGIFDLLNILSQNVDLFKNDIKLIIGGDGEVNKLKLFIKENNLNKIVEYVGWVSGEKKNELLNSTDVLILPSYNEGLPISLLEAMSYSMPIISTNVGGIPQVLTDLENGRMVEPGDFKQIEEAISFYIENKTKIALHGKNSYEKVQFFFPEKVITNLEYIYNKLLS